MSADLNSLLAPNDDKQFEQLCQHVLEHRFKTIWGQAYGRPGQAQHGVDFYIEIPAPSKSGDSAAVQIIGVQCKHKDRLLGGELGVKELEDEVNKAKGFKPELTTFIIATSAPTDTKLQDKARELTAEHQKQHPPLFSVEAWFWEKIRSEFSKTHDLKREILQRFYPNLILTHSAQHSVLHQLPAKPAHFTGRDEELAELEKEIASAHPAGATISGVRTKLHGAPGVGKTALAAVLAHKLKDRYQDAQLYLNLRGAGADTHGQYCTAVKSMTPAEAMQSIIHAFHPEEKLPEERDKLSVIYYGVLNEAGRVLLFLDNAADAAQVEPLLPPDNCLLLVTSRAQFSLPGLAVRNLDCLPPEMSQKLLRDLASRIEGHEKEAAELCGHLPLALKVFAGVANDKKLYPVPDLLKRLREGREKLAPVDAAFEVSYGLLNEELRYLLILLAMFPASCDLSAVAAVWERDDNAARANMQVLVNGSLVEYNAANGRFRLHDLVRQFCDEKRNLNEEGNKGAQLRYAKYFLNVGKQAGQLYSKGHEDTLAGIQLFDRERIHIETAFEILVKMIGIHHRSQLIAKSTISLNSQEIMNVVALGLCMFSDEIGTLRDLRVHPRDEIRWLQGHLIAARFLKNAQLEGIILSNIGRSHTRNGNARISLGFQEQALSIAKRHKYQQAEAWALSNMGDDYRKLGDATKAIECHEKQLAISRKIGDKTTEANALYLLACANVSLKEFKLAVEHVEKALHLHRIINNRICQAEDIGVLAHAYYRLGENLKAFEYQEQALALTRENGDIRGEGMSLCNLGVYYGDLGNQTKAIECYDRALIITRQTGNPRAEADVLTNYASTLKESGDLAQAINYAESALKIFETIEDPNADMVRKELTEWRRQVALPNNSQPQ